MTRSAFHGAGLTAAVIAATIAFIVAALLWLLAVGSAQGTWCPRDAREHSSVGLDTPRSLWPPGVACTTRLANGERAQSVEQVFDGASTVIVGLAAFGLGSLLLGTTVTIRRIATDAGPFADRAGPAADRASPTAQM